MWNIIYVSHNNLKWYQGFFFLSKVLAMQPSLGLNTWMGWSSCLCLLNVGIHLQQKQTKNPSRAEEMAQRAQVPSMKPDSLSTILGTKGRREPTSTSYSLILIPQGISNRPNIHLPLLGISSISQGLIFSVSPLSQL